MSDNTAEKMVMNMQIQTTPYTAQGNWVVRQLNSLSLLHQLCKSHQEAEKKAKERTRLAREFDAAVGCDA